MRKHPLQSFLTYGARFSTLWLVGVTEPVIALYTVLTAANSYMQHANLHVRTGAFAQVFATPELHRLHHSNRGDELDSNYGDLLIVFDTLFGTRREPDPARDLGGSVGLPGIEVPQTYASHLRLPFIWPRLTAEAGEAREP
jgi:sterol desaturase/sphingolipid hydroxylase (fatty acid hydroxylase superfamily)